MRPAAEVIDLSTHDWHVRVRQGLPFQVRWNSEGQPSHHFRTRAAAEAAIAAREPAPMYLCKTCGDAITRSWCPACDERAHGLEMAA